MSPLKNRRTAADLRNRGHRIVKLGKLDAGPGLNAVGQPLPPTGSYRVKKLDYRDITVALITPLDGGFQAFVYDREYNRVRVPGTFANTVDAAHAALDAKGVA